MAAMLTRGSNPKKRRNAAAGTINLLEKRLATMELKEELTKGDIQSILRMSKLLSDVSNDFKTYHFAIVDQLEEEEDEDAEQLILDQHETKVMEMIDRIVELVGEPSQKKKDADSESETPKSSDPPPTITKDRMVDRQLDILEDAARAIKRNVEVPGVDESVLVNYMDKIKSLEEELQGLKKEIISLEDFGERINRASGIERTLFELRVVITRLIKETKKEPVPKVVETPLMTSVSLPRIEIPTFDGNILNWQLFWEQFQAAVHDKPHLGEIDKLTYLRDAVKGGPARNVIQGLTQTVESYKEAIECLRARYDRPRIIHREHVRSIIQAPVMKSNSGRELRRLYDLCNQHIRAIKASEHYDLDTFLTVVMELKLDEASRQKWMEFTNEAQMTPTQDEMLRFLDLQARQFEPISSERKPQMTFHKSYATAVEETCVVCSRGSHHLSNCFKFQNMTRDERWDIVKKGARCKNCLKPGHMANKCRAPPMCKKCRKYHHSLLHIDEDAKSEETKQIKKDLTYVAPSHGGEVLLMTCRVKVIAPDGSVTQARALLDCAASTSLITERLAQQLRLSRHRCNFTINGVAGIDVHPRGTVNFKVAGMRESYKGDPIEVEASVLPRVTADLPTLPVAPVTKWKHLSNLEFADPNYGTPARIDILLGGKVFSKAVLYGRRYGPSGSPSAFKTRFGWVLNGEAGSKCKKSTTHICCVALDNDILRRFWEIEDHNLQRPVYSQEEKAVVRHFELNHRRDAEGRYIVPLPRKEGVKPLGESKTQTLRRFKMMERSLRAKKTFGEFAEVVREYLTMKHAEQVPNMEIVSPGTETYYLPMHAVHKRDSTTSKLRVVFDASAKSDTGTSLNDHLLVGPTVHPPLVDVLLRFRQFKIALTSDVSRMYRAVRIPDNQKDLHRFLWREDPEESITEYRMNRLTFGVCASSFAANMTLRQNAINYSRSHPEASRAVLESFYVDDGLTGADSVEAAIHLRNELQDMFQLGGFTLRKWKSSNEEVLSSIPQDYRDSKASQEIHCQEEYTKVLGMEWNMVSDCFRPMVPMFKFDETLTKRVLVSNIARLYDVLGWYSPTIIQMKILLQKLWELNLTWDEPVPEDIASAWKKWHVQVKVLKDFSIPRAYFPKDVVRTKELQLHGFCDASEVAYSGVVYIRMKDPKGNIHIALIVAKTKVAPIKRLSVPRLELCGAVILAKLLSHAAKLLNIPSSNIFAWTDSRVTLGWLQGNPRRFLTFVGNRIAEISETIPVGCWRHVKGSENPADCASRGIFPAELTNHDIWWKGPEWLKEAENNWNVKGDFEIHSIPSEEHNNQRVLFPIVALDPPMLKRISNYNRLTRVTAWILRFVKNCKEKGEKITNPILSLPEIRRAEKLWWRIAQKSAFQEEITNLRNGKEISHKSKILTFHPFVDDQEILRVGGRLQKAKLAFSERHPVLLPRNHKITELIIRSEHLRLMHAGPTLVSASLSRRFRILGGRRVIRDITGKCVICKKIIARPKPQLHGQLPADRVNPGPVFDRIGIDYAGPVMVKYGPIRKPRYTKGYIAVFVCLSTKAVHLELVSDLTTSAFLATLRRFIGRRGVPKIIWSDHGTNFVGAKSEIANLLRDERSATSITGFCTSRNIEWKFIPERTPHFGGLWEAAVKSLKLHLKKVLGEAKLNFEEFTTVLVQVEACLNSRPLTSIPESSDNLEVLTPGHFLIGRPITALPDESDTQIVGPLRRWRFCQILVRHLWTRWSQEYLRILNQFSRWHSTNKDYRIGDIVCLRDEPTAPTRWPLARVVDVHPGEDGKVRVVTVKTAKGIYKRPVVKVIPLIQEES